MEKFNQEDISGLIALSASVGWDYDKQEINTIMTAGNVFGHKTINGEIISSAAIIPYDDKLASIGMVIVNGNYRRYGLGKVVTQACIDAVPNNVPIMLIATEEGQPLYQKLGFHTVASVHKFLCDTYSSITLVQIDEEYETIPITDSHFMQIFELDRNAVGAGRREFLESRIRQAKKGIIIKQNNGKILGYGLGVEGPINLILGPIVAINHSIASHIVHELGKGYEGNLRIDVPEGKDDFLAYLEQCGFKKVSQPPVMIKNTNQLPLRDGTLFSIAAQIFG
jgi:predicted GNAT family N-acyltransferase